MVAPGVVLTARHVFNGEEVELEAGRKEILCTGIGDSGLTLWRCAQVTMLDATDIALLMVESASELPSVLRFATISTRLPRIGERIMIAGVKQDTVDHVPIDSEIELSMMVAHGFVSERYESGRDSVILPGPSIQIECSALGGMSGGPAFDVNGFLIGVLTSSMSFDSGGASFVSLLWPALGVTIKPIWPNGLHKAPATLIGMDRRLCAIHGPQTISTTWNEAQGREETTYQKWEH